jgi:hypothetical protein
LVDDCRVEGEEVEVERGDWAHGTAGERHVGLVEEHYLLDALNAHPIDLDKEVPVHSKDEKVPYMPQWYLLDSGLEAIMDACILRPPIAAAILFISFP